VMRTTSRQIGFTLIEVLVAVAIFAVVASVAYSALSNAVGNEQALADHSDQLRELQFAVGLIERDLRLALPRSQRDRSGQSQAPIQSDGRALRLLRSGFANPMRLSRAELESIDYQLEGGRWQRLRWPSLDHARTSRPAVDILQTDIQSLSFLFLDRQNRWQAQWPSPTAIVEGEAELWPRAVRFRLNSRRWGTVERVIELVDGLPSSAGPTTVTDS